MRASRCSPSWRTGETRSQAPHIPRPLAPAPSRFALPLTGAPQEDTGRRAGTQDGVPGQRRLRWHIQCLSAQARFSCFGIVANPGPSFTLLSANITSVEHLPLLAAALCGDGVILVQEPRGTEVAADRVRSALRPFGVFAEPNLGKSQLVSCATRNGPLRNFELALAPRIGERVSHQAVGTGGGTVHVLNVYAPCGAGRGGEDTQQCEAILQAALLRAAEIGQVPCFIVGDFNQDPLPSGGAAALALAGWRGLGLELGPTTRPGGGRNGRRIDRVYANAAAATLSLSAGTRVLPRTRPLRSS